MILAPDCPRKIYFGRYENCRVWLSGTVPLAGPGVAPFDNGDDDATVTLHHPAPDSSLQVPYGIPRMTVI